MTGSHCCLQASANSITCPVSKSTSRGRKIRWKAFLQTSQSWICCSIMADVLPRHIIGYFGGTGEMATTMHASLEGVVPIVQSMFPKHRYTCHSFLLHDHDQRCVWLELPNEGTNVSPSSCCPNWRSQNYGSYDEVQLTYQFIPPQVAWIQL